MDDIEKIKQKTDIVDFISGYIPLKKMGRNFKALCPFHGEKTPSFVVSPERQIWHCFGCNLGGDIFSFLMQYDKIEFSESLKFLAERAGVKLAAPVFRNETEKKKELIYSLNNLSAQFYHFVLLNHPAGRRALSYFEGKRKIPRPLINTFLLGFAPNKHNALTQYLIQKKGYKVEDLINAGLTFKRDGRLLDFFRDRIIFPIFDARDNIIAFSARALDNTTLPKYINTKETHVYKKGDTLFGLSLARDAIKKEGKVIVVEGEFDVISAHREGILNIVAVKGTALTQNQIKLLKRYAQKLLFCFDSDVAGTEAQRRSIEMIDKEGISASVVILPSGKDPDELLSKDPVLFKQAIKKDVNIYDYIIDSALYSENKTTSQGKIVILQKTLPFLVVIDNEVVKEHYLKKLAELLDSSLESVLKQAEKVITPSKKITPEIVKKTKERPETLEEYLLALLLQAEEPKKYIQSVKQILSGHELSTPIIKMLYSSLTDFVSNQEFEVRNFVKTLPGELLPAFDNCYLAPLPHFKDEAEYGSEVEKVAREIKLFSVKNRLKIISSELKEKDGKSSEEEIGKLHVEFQKLSELLR